MKNNEIMKELRSKAERKGAMGGETVSITLNKENIDIDGLMDGISYEIDGDYIALSCEAEMVY